MLTILFNYGRNKWDLCFICSFSLLSMDCLCKKRWNTIAPRLRVTKSPNKIGCENSSKLHESFIGSISGLKNDRLIACWIDKEVRRGIVV